MEGKEKASKKESKEGRSKEGQRERNEEKQIRCANQQQNRKIIDSEDDCRSGSENVSHKQLVFLKTANKTK